MDAGPSRSNLKRPFPEDDDSNEPPSQKRVRFPKGKKVKEGDYVVDLRKQAQGIPEDRKDPRLAAKQRAIQRNKMTSELFSEENRGMLKDITKAEVTYQDNDTFVDDGIQIEPFNLENEREQGYFDAEGNFVEYVDDNEIKDAWLDSIDVDTKYAEKSFMVTNEDDSSDLSSEAIGRMKRRIADALEPGETVLQALRRLKGTSNSKKEKMPAETKVIFEQLTEDAMKLMENGDYNVYDERQEDFQREAEGYESLAQARGEGTSMNSQRGTSDNKMANACLFSRKENGITSSLPSETVAGDDTFDMFAEDDENTTANATSNANNSVSGINHDDGQPSRTVDMENDYVYDDSSGYYYSSSLGYYYDPSSGFYCCAASGQWYSYNEETGVYDEIQQASSTLC